MTPTEAQEILQQRLAELPERITLDDIARVTGRTAHYIRHYWANSPERNFPPGEEKPGQAKTFNRQAVAQWCQGNQIGIQLRASEIDDRRRDHITTAQIAERLGLRDPSAVRYHARNHPPGSDDPYPQQDGDGHRYWPDVLAWHRRHEKAPRTRPGKPPTAGLTPRQQQVRAAVETARTQGRTLTAADLADELGIHPDSARRLLRQLDSKTST